MYGTKFLNLLIQNHGLSRVLIFAIIKLQQLIHNLYSSNPGVTVQMKLWHLNKDCENGVLILLYIPPSPLF